MSDYSAPTEMKTTRRRKAQAVTAGGIVLGIGAIVTLAAWNDSEFAEGLFGSGDFNLEVSTDGEDFTDHYPEDGAAQLTFAADNMIPGETVYAPLWVRLDNATTVAGDILPDDIEIIARDNDEGANNADSLSYNIYTDVVACNDASNVGASDPIASANSLESGPSGNSNIALAPGDGVAGETVLLCFEVTASDSGEEFTRDLPTEATWEVTATSRD